MAIIANRVKLQIKKTGKIRATFIGKLMNLTILLILSILAINPELLRSRNIFTEINGFVSQRVIIPTANFVKFTTNLTVSLMNFHSLQDENIRLKTRLKKMENIEKKSYFLKDQNNKLSELLKVAMNEPENVIRAIIISHSRSIADNNILVSAGSKNEVMVDQMVLSNGFLAGRVIEVSNNYSKIMPINDHNSRISVKTSDSNIRAIFRGNGNRGGLLIHLPPNLKPKIGETILTSGDGGIFSPNIPIGKIVNIEESAIIVESFANISQVDYITILKNN